MYGVCVFFFGLNIGILLFERINLELGSFVFFRVFKLRLIFKFVRRRDIVILCLMNVQVEVMNFLYIYVFIVFLWKVDGKKRVVLERYIVCGGGDFVVLVWDFVYLLFFVVLVKLI